MESDPGVAVSIAEASGSMREFVPPEAEIGGAAGGSWDATNIDHPGLLDEEPSFVLSDQGVRTEGPGLPCMKVQVTRFEDGLAVAVGLVHSLADARTLVGFVRDWANVCRELGDGGEPDTVVPLFDPERLDEAAAGEIDAATPDSDIIAKAAKLPLHRHDWWGSAKYCPEWALANTKVPAEVGQVELEHEKAVPWLEWDGGAPVSHVEFVFSPKEVKGIYDSVTRFLGMDKSVSHFDSLQAHLWAAILRARGRGHKQDEDCWLDISIDARRRLDPPLPESFVGSPFVGAGVRTQAVPEELSSYEKERDVASKAVAIRSTIRKYDHEAMAAYLHEVAFEKGAQRRWNVFLGERHTIVTSWAGIGAWDVVFDKDVGVPRWVEPTIPFCDNVVIVMEGPKGMGSAWWSNGVTMSVWLKTDAMGRLMEDKQLRAFR